MIVLIVSILATIFHRLRIASLFMALYDRFHDNIVAKTLFFTSFLEFESMIVLDCLKLRAFQYRGGVCEGFEVLQGALSAFKWRAGAAGTVSTIGAIGQRS